jgi:CBS domain-containing protein
MTTLAKKIMTKKICTVPMGTSLFEANKIMTEKRIRHLPVIDELDDVVGVISQRDLNAIPESKSIPVELMMSRPVEYIRETESLRHAVFALLQKKISSLLVTNDIDDVVGIITTDDVLWFTAHMLDNEPVEATKDKYNHLTVNEMLQRQTFI